MHILFLHSLKQEPTVNYRLRSL